MDHHTKIASIVGGFKQERTTNKRNWGWPVDEHSKSHAKSKIASDSGDSIVQRSVLCATMEADNLNVRHAVL